ncbi:hypothetical protein TSAR_007792 [Trichomalopsis sarcophagae]|uniref:Uncharacterized protein n=1 Tax=Trichomalopsis sarcophagae TaxID=543379 RepID=A0A232FL88_9HYME|nr:hypothetical protein TSAR_007792 [Trichomalopsis sarcophagae]
MKKELVKRCEKRIKPEKKYCTNSLTTLTIRVSSDGPPELSPPALCRVSRSQHQHRRLGGTWPQRKPDRTNKMNLIFDTQGFKGQNDEFIIKELVYIDPNEPAAVAQLATFQSPHSWYHLSSDVQLANLWLNVPICGLSILKYVQCANLWLKYSFHGFKWSDGERPSDKLAEVCSSLLDLFLTRNVIVGVKGAQKKEWLQLYFPDVWNIENLGCPSLKTLGFRVPVSLNTVAKAPPFLPMKKIKDLEINKKYRISKHIKVQTKFGTKMVLELDVSFDVIIPTKISSMAWAFSDHMILEM